VARRRALVVDADWRMRKLVRMNLEAQGLEVGEAVSSGECSAALAEQPWDLVLIAASLPGGNGWNLVAQLRRAPQARDLPIIVFVPEPARNRLLRRFEHVSTLVEPFSATELLACVERALGSTSGHSPVVY